MKASDKSDRSPLCPSLSSFARPLAFAALSCVAALLVLPSTRAWTTQGDERRIIGPNDPQQGCVRCHESEVRGWKKSKHKSSIDVLDEDEAWDIAAKLGLDDDPYEIPLCQSCHVTMFAGDGAVPEPEWGVSCESCHGAAEHWVDVHSRYGTDAQGSKVTKSEKETPEHRRERIAQAEAAGMIRPASIYRLASNCYHCHTVPREELVNVGGHSAGSEMFDLVVWSQGEVRHNFLNGKENRDIPQARKRVLYVVGKLVDLELSLRALAAAKEDGNYATAMAKRVESAKESITAIQAALESAQPVEAAVLDLAAQTELRAGNGAALTQEADAIREIGMKFAEQHADGAKLGGVDGLIPTESKGTVFKP